jgi:Capsule assembly protein Wzi
MPIFRSCVNTACLWLCGLLIGCILATPAWCSSVNVPLDHWSYRAIDTLIGFGLIRTAMLGTKPFTRAEMARLIVEASQRVDGLRPHQSVVAKDLLQQLHGAFRDEVRFRDGEAVTVPATLLKPLDELAVQYVHLDGVPIRMLPESSIDASEGTPLVRNNEGINYRDGENFLLTTTTYGKVWDWFSFFVQPLFTLKGDVDDDWVATARLHKGYAKGQLGYVELEFGRDAIRWGQGERGTLVFSNHAPPLDFIKISTPQPVLLPWIFQHLGLFKAETFLTQLEDDRDVSRPKVWGWRLLAKPTSWFEIGVLEATQFDGEGVPGLKAEDILKILTFQRIGEEDAGKANQLLAFDWRITLPFLRFTQFYAEIGFEDRGDIGVLAGLYVPRLTADGRTTFRFEWMRNTIHIDKIAGVWYTHSTFTSGFTFDGMVLGHASGGENQEFFWRLTRNLTAHAILGFDAAYRWRRGGRLVAGSTTQESHYEGGLDLQYFFTAAWEVDVRFAAEKVQNFNLQPDTDRENLLLWLQVKYHFSALP